jgi:hypothetical protein
LVGSLFGWGDGGVGFASTSRRNLIRQHAYVGDGISKASHGADGPRTARLAAKTWHHQDVSMSQAIRESPASDTRLVARAWSYAKSNPTEIVSMTVFVAVLVATVADLLDLLTISPNVFSSMVLVLGSVVGIEYVLASSRRHSNDSLLRNLAREVSDIATSLESGVQLREVAPQEIAPALGELLRGATEWSFRGGSGIWQRTHAIPILSAEKNHDVPYVAHVLDPREAGLCNTYAQYRLKQRPASAQRSGEGDAATIRDEILALIYCAAWYGAHSRLRPQVVLGTEYSPARVDLANSGAVVTVADHKATGLWAARESWYYHALKDEIHESVKSAARLDFPREGQALFPTDPDRVTAAHVEEFFSQCVVKPRHGDSLPFAMDQWVTVDWTNVAARVFPER